MNDKGLKSLLFTELDSYQDFVNNYFSTFLFNIFAYRVKTYQETTKKMKFNSIIN
jgi:hypothetical protein